MFSPINLIVAVFPSIIEIGLPDVDVIFKLLILTVAIPSITIFSVLVPLTVTSPE